MVHVFVKKLVDEWAKMGHNCIVLSPLSMTHVLLGKEKKAPISDEYVVIPGKSVRVYRPRYYSIPRVRLFGIDISSYMQQRCVERTLKAVGISIDVIYCHFYITIPAVWHFASENKIPLFVATGESSMAPMLKPCKSFSIEKMKESLYGVVAVSSKNKKEAVELGYAKEHDTIVFPNGTDLKVFYKRDKIECRERLGFPSDSFIIICVGQFVERKGQKRILKAIDILNNNKIKTVFIGKGDDQFEHDSIIYKGSINNNDLPIFLNAADVFVLPTQGEGCCNAIIEALACGLPIISSNRPFNYDVLNESNSILVEPDSIEEISEAIDKLYNDEHLRFSMSQRSLEMGQHLSIEKRANNILAFMLNRILESSK